MVDVLRPQVKGENAEILIPFPAKWQLPYCTLIGRLKPNVSLSQARAEAHVINGRLSFFTMRSQEVFISPLTKIEYVDRTTLLSLFGAVIFLVLIACTLALTRIFAGLLFEIKPTDPVTFVLVSVLSLVVALLSSYIPARRSSRIDPMGTLRCE